jgi:hypothetical protein
LRAEIEGIHGIRTQKNFAVNVLKKYMRISDPDILEEGYRYALRFIQPRPFPSVEETRAVLEELKRPDAKPENFIDLSLMQELEKERFFDKLK